MSEEEDFFRFAGYDWLVTDSGQRLHAYASGTFDGDYWGVTGGRFACGRRFNLAVIPGIFTRMGAMRCQRCCDVTGLPRGKGSPKNDPACASGPVSAARVTAAPEAGDDPRGRERGRGGAEAARYGGTTTMQFRGDQ